MKRDPTFSGDVPPSVADSVASSRPMLVLVSFQPLNAEEPLCTGGVRVVISYILVDLPSIGMILLF